jgi:hypothetical protein
MLRVVQTIQSHVTTTPDCHSRSSGEFQFFSGIISLFNTLRGEIRNPAQKIISRIDQMILQIPMIEFIPFFGIRYLIKGKGCRLIVR